MVQQVGSGSDNNIFHFLAGGGEMGHLTRTFDWSRTSLGTPDQWPQSLRTTLSIILHSKFPMFLFWGPELICFYNDAYRPSLGNNGKHPSALGSRGVDVFPEIWPDIKPLIDTVLAGGEANWSEDQLLPIYRNGKMEDVYWTFSYSPVNDESGNPSGVFVTCTETTGKILSLSNLIESEDQLRFAIEAAELATFDLNPLTNKFIANERLRDWFGLKPGDEADLSDAINSISEKDRDFVVASINNALTYESGGLYDIEYAIINPVTKKERIVRAKGMARFNEDKVPYRFNGTLQDITKQKNSQREIAEAEERTRMATESANLGPFEINLLTKEILASPRFDEIYGVAHSERHKDYINAIHPDDMPVRAEAYRRAKETGIMDYEARVPQKDGSVLWVRAMGKMHFDVDGVPYRISGVVQDITERRENENRLMDAADHLQLALDAGKLGSYEYDLNTGEITGTPQFKETFGLKEGAPFNIDLFFASLLEEDREHTLERVTSAVANKTNYGAEYRIKWPDGSIRWIKASGKPIYDESDNPSKIVGITLDISEQKLFEEELNRMVTERTLELKRSNEDLLQFAHVTSHDLKEPVRKIRIYTEKIQRDYGSLLPAAGNTSLDKVQVAADRMLAMIEGVLTFSALNASDELFEIIDLNEVIKNIEADLEMMIRLKDAAIIKSNLPRVQGASVLIYQLFYNLVNNALKFSRPDVRTAIRISSAEKLHHGKVFAEIRIEDNGIGFEQEYALRIFNTFARLNSKDKYEGTGLGLALCKKIAERHGGTITATGVEGQGAGFTVLLPLPAKEK